MKRKSVIFGRRLNFSIRRHRVDEPSVHQLQDRVPRPIVLVEVIDERVYHRGRVHDDEGEHPCFGEQYQDAEAPVHIFVLVLQRGDIDHGKVEDEIEREHVEVHVHDDGNDVPLELEHEDHIDDIEKDQYVDESRDFLDLVCQDRCGSHTLPPCSLVIAFSLPLPGEGRSSHSVRIRRSRCPCRLF